MSTAEQIEQIAIAFDRRDYEAAAQLLEPLAQQSPNHPWVQLFSARLHEVSGRMAAAEVIYRKLLQQTTNARIALQARHGLQRLDEAEKARRQAAIDRSTADPDSAQLGFLVLEPLTLEQRKHAIPAFARLMKLDAYTARIHLSHRGWKLYRTGALGELRVYAEELKAIGVPAFCVGKDAIAKIRTFRVSYVQAIDSKITVVCLNEADQRGTLSFSPSEVSQRIEGLLPIFEDVVDLGAWNVLKRKEQTQDYAQVNDFHLPRRKCLLRFCDLTYQFQHGINVDDTSSEDVPIIQTTNRLRWNRLTSMLHTSLSEVPIQADFNPFAETALEHLSLVGDRLKSHIDLFRRRETYWDEAFHLYTSLHFLHQQTQSD